MPDKVKLTVNILESEYEELKRTAEAQGISVTDALRRSLNLTSQLNKLTAGEDKDLLLRDRKGEIERLVLP